MAPKLYLLYESTPCRAVLITARAIGLDLTEEVLSLFAGKHLEPEFLKINPQHTVPTFVDDDGFTLWDSHAIMTYIVSKYAKDDSLYPKDLKKRALVDQRLHFDSSVAYQTLRNTVLPIYFKGKNTVYQEDKDTANEVYGFVEAFLEGREWIAGDSVTIADYSINTGVTGINILVPLDAGRFPKVAAWLKKCEELPEFEVNLEGLRLYRQLLRSKVTEV